MPTVNTTKPLIGLTCRWDEANDWYYLPREYAQAVAAAGGIAVQVPLISGIAAELAARLDGYVLTGSPSDVDPARYGQERHSEVKTIHPERDETDVAILEQAFQEKKPVLGICFGMQSLNVYLGGTLVQHIPDIQAGLSDPPKHRDRTTMHGIRIEAGSRIAEWAGESPELQVNSTHHQSIQKPGQGLRVAARAPDGVIEAVEGMSPAHFVLGVQWHPERIWRHEHLSARIFSELVWAASQWRQAARK